MVAGGGINLGYPLGAETGSPGSRRLFPNLVPPGGTEATEAGTIGVVFKLANRLCGMRASLFFAAAELFHSLIKRSALSQINLLTLC